MVITITEKGNLVYTCPYCNHKVMSKPRLVVAILNLIGYKHEKSIYGAGTFNQAEMLAIYDWINKT